MPDDADNGKPTKTRQKELPGIGTAMIPEISRAVKKYLEHRDDFQSAADRVGKAKDKVIELMNEHKIEAYRAHGFVAQLTHGKDGLKVRSLEVEAVED